MKHLQEPGSPGLLPTVQPTRLARGQRKGQRRRSRGSCGIGGDQHAATARATAARTGTNGSMRCQPSVYASSSASWSGRGDT